MRRRKKANRKYRFGFFTKLPMRHSRRRFKIVKEMGKKFKKDFFCLILSLYLWKSKPIDTWTDDVAKWFLEFIKGCTKKEPQERLEWDKIIQQLHQKIDAVGKEYERMLNSMQDISAN